MKSGKEVIEKARSYRHLSTMTWDDINKAGAYVSSTGQLYRVPAMVVSRGHSPSMIEVLGPRGAEMMTCISPDPNAPIDALRELAADADIEPHF